MVFVPEERSDELVSRIVRIFFMLIQHFIKVYFDLLTVCMTRDDEITINRGLTGILEIPHEIAVNFMIFKII